MPDFTKLKRFSLMLLIFLLGAFLWFQLVAHWTSGELIELNNRKNFSIDSMKRIESVDTAYISTLIFKIENYQLKHD